MPGAEIRRRLLLAHGSFDHHVRHLKSDGLLVSVEAGNQLTYYLPSQLKGERAQPRHTDAVVEAFLRDHPAASSQQIAAGCGIPQSTVESHLRGLERAGRVLRAKQGRRYVFEAVAGSKAQHGDGSPVHGFTLAPTAAQAPVGTRAELATRTAEDASKRPSEPRVARATK